MYSGPADAAANSAINLRRIATYPGIRVLVWDSDVLYACRGYQILRLHVVQEGQHWQPVARYRPAWWRELTVRNRLAYRFVRDGFHALAVLDEGSMVGAVPGAIVTRSVDRNDFHVTHRILRGTRPLHITATASGRMYWGEYFDNPDREEVHIYVSEDRGATWQVAYTFPAGAIRHVHNIVNDAWRECLWILTGDEGSECKILRASYDFRSVETVVAGNQQARVVAAISSEQGLFLSTDTPYEKNHVYRLDLGGRLELVGELNSSSIYGCRVGDSLFFSTMAEPSTVNDQSEVHIAGSRIGRDWKPLLTWKKDFWPMRYFQYGNIVLPDGNNTTQVLAATTVGTAEDDLTTSLWAVS